MGLDLTILIKKYPESRHCSDILHFERDSQLFEKIRALSNKNGNLSRDWVRYFDIEGNLLEVIKDAYGYHILSVEAHKLSKVIQEHLNSNISIAAYLDLQNEKCEAYLYWN